MKLYHVSTTPGLSVLEPRVSSHGKAWVYATKNLEFALLFGSNKSNGDFDGIYGINKDNNTPYFIEAYEGAFRKRFEKCVCYVYEVDPKTFKENMTSFKHELVSDEPVKILNCKKIDDLYEYLMELVANKKLILTTYSMDEEYQSRIKEHIKSRILMFNILQLKESKDYKLCLEKFPEVIKELTTLDN